MHEIDVVCLTVALSTPSAPYSERSSRTNVVCGHKWHPSAMCMQRNYEKLQEYLHKSSPRQSSQQTYLQVVTPGQAV